MMAMALARPYRLLLGLATLCCLMLAARWITMVPAPELVENRRLAPAPTPGQLLTDFNAYRTGMEAYATDHFPARRHLIGGLNYLRYRLGYSGTSRVVVGEDGWLFYDDTTHLSQLRPSNLAPADVQAWVAQLQVRERYLAARRIPYLVVAAPVKEQIYPERVPAFLRGEPGRSDSSVLSLAAAEAHMENVVDLHAPLRRAKARGMPVYSPFDTHWTGEGAYVAYETLMSAVRERGVAVKSFPHNEFSAPPAAAAPPPQDLAYMLGIASFVTQHYPQLGSQASPEQVRFLTEHRQWDAERVIDTGNPGPVLLMTGDSFSTALLPLLAKSFRRIVFSHHQNGFFRPDLVEQFHPDVVLLEVIESGFRHAMQPAATAPAVAGQGKS